MSSGGVLYNPFYEPVVAERYFSRRRKYDEVFANRTSLFKMVDAFEDRIRDWYVEPIEVLLEIGISQWRRKIIRWLARRQDGGHYSFTVAAMTCLLIDSLSQFERGISEGTNVDFKAFVRQYLPAYAVGLAPPIDGYRPPQGNATSPRCQPLSDVADVLYHGFRCGILHQAHAPLYCGIVPGNNPPKVEATNHAKYASGATGSVLGADCPVVVFCPEHLFADVMGFLASYLRNLKDRNPANDKLRENFKKKFSESFGIDITTAIL